jgi:hypothetical protein
MRESTGGKAPRIRRNSVFVDLCCVCLKAIAAGVPSDVVRRRLTLGMTSVVPIGTVVGERRLQRRGATTHARTWCGSGPGGYKLCYIFLTAALGTKHAVRGPTLGGPNPIWRKAKSDHLCPGNFICSAPPVNASRAAGCLACTPSASGVATAEGTSARYAVNPSDQPRWNSKFRSRKTGVGMTTTVMLRPERPSGFTSRATPSGNSNVPTTRQPLSLKLPIRATLGPLA